MSKITFRADNDLVERLEAFDASKSEVMREALRAYLDAHEEPEGDVNASETAYTSGSGDDADTLDDALARRIDELLADRLSDHRGAYTRSEPAPVTVNVTLDGVGADDATVQTERETADEGERKTSNEASESRVSHGTHSCSQCGENVTSDHVYCPNCGEKTSHRAFCECGDEIRSDWAFCPSCGRRTPAADVLDSS